MNRGRNLWAVLLGATLVVTGCTGSSDGAGADGPADAEESTHVAETDHDADAEEAATPESEAPEEQEEPTEPDAVPFDPNAEIRPADITARTIGASEETNPWEHAYLPDDFVLPATAHMVTWDPPEEPFDGNEQNAGRNGSAAFHLYDVTEEELSGFFTSRLPEQGWELEDLHEADGWRQDWVILLEWDGWDEEWKFDEHRVKVTVRVVYIPGEDPVTMQFYYTADRCVASGCQS